MITIQSGETCKFSSRCPFNKNEHCQGTNPYRGNVFTCHFVMENGIFNGAGKERNASDTTGNMKVIMEGS